MVIVIRHAHARVGSIVVEAQRGDESDEHQHADQREECEVQGRHSTPPLVNAPIRGCISRYLEPSRSSAANRASTLPATRRTKVVSARLGHASTGITEDVYSHVLDTMQEQATEDLERAILGAKKA